VVADLVTRSQSVGVVGKGAVHDAALGADSVAAESGDGVKNVRVDEVACVARFIPVSSRSS
jgi:hypothetical protein